MNCKKILLGLAAAPLMTLAAPHGIERANLDPGVDPGEDFYLYACGGWRAANPLKPEYSRFGTFDQLRENARDQLRDLIANLALDPQAKVKGTNAQKVCDIYSMAMDSLRLNKEGAAPLKEFLRKVESSDRKDLEALLAWEHDGITNSFFGVGVGSDPKNSDINILHIGEAGIGLGDRDYYLEENETNSRIMEAYHNYVVTMMKLAGYNDPDAERVWKNVIDIETEIARHKKTREQRRDPQLRYNMMTIDQIRTEFGNIDWNRYLDCRGLSGVDKANVSSVDYMKFLNTWIPTLSDRQIKDYIAYEVISDSSNLLSDAFRDANFEMFGRVMSGQLEQQPRWKQAMELPNSMLGEAVGELYVARYFPEENKRYMKGLVENLRKALGKHIDNLTWMSDSTKAKAHEKLAAFTVKIGYPDKWKDYSGIEIDPSLSLMENVYNASVWYTRDNLDKLGKPVDKEEWHMTPQTVNAYYNPTTNEICFPAAILQAPYFDMTADDAQNYGAIGVVIGHEMTHGFDDSGRQYDKNGNLNDWWEPQDAEKFKTLADGLVAQFDAVEVAPGVYANGRFTLGENIADQGGLRVALTAYLDATEGKAADIDGFSPMQRFYLAYANVWADNIRDEEILSRTKTDPHALGRNRVNVSLRNLSQFFDAFGIKEGDRMWLPADKRIIIW